MCNVYIRKERRKVTKHIEKKNIHPYRLSCGEYDKLAQIMIREASSSTPTNESHLILISPPPCLERWKRAQTKILGEYTFEETRIIAEL